MIKELIKKLLAKRTDKEYWVHLRDIKIPKRFARTRIRPEKWERKWNYFLETGELESKIVLNQDYLLVDGYSSYKIAKKAGIGKVPVWFAEK